MEEDDEDNEDNEDNEDDEEVGGIFARSIDFDRVSLMALNMCTIPSLRCMGLPRSCTSKGSSIQNLQGSNAVIFEGTKGFRSDADADGPVRPKNRPKPPWPGPRSLSSLYMLGSSRKEAMAP